MKQAATIAGRLAQIIATCGMAAPAVSVYWPIRGEPDLRAWMHALFQSGVRVRVTGRHRACSAARVSRMASRGSTGSRAVEHPHPADGKLIVPNVVIAPVVGFDLEGFRLGYGGGFFDRTLARLNPKL